MRLTSESKILLAVVAFTVSIIAVAVILIAKTAPALTREDLVPVAAHIKGNPKASVYLVEFSDFQCPACAAVKPLVDDIIKTYGDKLLFAYRHYPLPQHPLAQTAARAAEAAGAQGKFWEMYDLIFAKSETLTESDFADFAKQLNLDQIKFASDMKSNSVVARVQSDINEGNTLNINATPTFFLNGKKLELTSLNDLTTSVEQAVNK
jgi:protein-disulfide isomerase